MSAVVGITARELEERLDALRAAVEQSVADFEQGKPPARIFAGLRRQLEFVPAGRWTRESCVEKAHEWCELHGEPPKAVDWNPAQARAREREDLVERYLAGDWPSASTIARLFTRWNLFLEAAGYEGRHGPEDLSNAGGAIDYTGMPEWTGWTLIERYRRARGLSQGQLARAIGTSESYIGVLERGVRSNPTVRTVLALAQAFRVGPGALMTHQAASDVKSVHTSG